jgi:FkbM family methyltransferase
MVRASRQGDVASLYRDTLIGSQADRLVDVDVDMTNCQFLGAALFESPFSGGYEPEILALLSAFLPKDGVLYDVGSNWGYCSFHALLDPHSFGRVVAFEPVRASYNDLRRLASKLGLEHRLIALNIAAGVEANCLPISDHEWSGNQSLVVAAPDNEEVQVKPIDELPIPKPGFIKLDVENYEAEALRGMQGLINERRPPIVFENWFLPDRPTQYLQSLSILTQLGYSLYVPRFEPSTVPDSMIPFEVSGDLTLDPVSPESRQKYPERINIFAHPAGL